MKYILILALMVSSFAAVAASGLTEREVDYCTSAAKIVEVITNERIKGTSEYDMKMALINSDISNQVIGVFIDATSVIYRLNVTTENKGKYIKSFFFGCLETAEKTDAFRF